MTRRGRASASSSSRRKAGISGSPEPSCGTPPIRAFRSERDGGGIFATDLAGRTVRRLAPFGYDPAWSPDGQEIVVATEGVYDPLNRRSMSHLWRIDLRSGQRRRLTSEDSVQPAWSPHGQRIAFWHLWHNGGQRDIATVAADRLSEMERGVGHRYITEAIQTAAISAPARVGSVATCA